MTSYTDTAHAITYDLDADGNAEMTCRSCGRTFTGQPADTTSESAPYNAYGDPWDGCLTVAEVAREIGIEEWQLLGFDQTLTADSTITAEDVASIRQAWDAVSAESAE